MSGRRPAVAVAAPTSGISAAVSGRIRRAEADAVPVGMGTAALATRRPLRPHSPPSLPSHGEVSADCQLGVPLIALSDQTRLVPSGQPVAVGALISLQQAHSDGPVGDRAQRCSSLFCTRCSHGLRAGQTEVLRHGLTD